MAINTETAEKHEPLFADGGSWAKLALVAVAFAALYHGAFASLAGAWWENDAYSHGFFVPLISLYLVWERRRWLASVPARPAMVTGTLAVALSALVHVAGMVMSVSLVSEVSLVAMVGSLALLLGGWSRLRVLAFPVAYLLFMVPFLRGVTDRVYWPFQLFAAKAGTAMMELMGIPVLLERQFIELPNVMLEVAVECSGIHYLISIVAIGVPLAYLTQRTWSRKVGLVALAVVIAVVANAVRVAFIGAWAYYYDPSHIHGPFHVFQGFLVSQVGFAALFVGAWVLSRGAGRSKRAQAGPSPRAYPAAAGRKGPGWKAWAAAFLILGAFAAYVHARSDEPVPLAKNLASLPTTLGEWKGEDRNPESWPVLSQNADHELLRTYTNGDGEEVTLYIAYYESQGQGREMLNYSLMMLNRDSEEEEVELPGGDSLTVNRKAVRSGDSAQVVYFWYELNGRRTTGLYSTKLAMLRDSLIRGRTNGAVVAVVTPAKSGANLRADILADFYPVIEEYLP